MQEMIRAARKQNDADDCDGQLQEAAFAALTRVALSALIFSD